MGEGLLVRAKEHWQSYIGKIIQHVYKTCVCKTDRHTEQYHSIKGAVRPNPACLEYTAMNEPGVRHYSKTVSGLDSPLEYAGFWQHKSGWQGSTGQCLSNLPSTKGACSRLVPSRHGHRWEIQQFTGNPLRSSLGASCPAEQ